MSEIREFNPDGSLKRLTVDNTDRELTLHLENLSRQIPVDVTNIIYQELDSFGTVTRTINKTREQLLNAIDTYSFVFDFTYYRTGEIDTIRIRIFDASAVKLDDKILKHYLNGRQPEFI